MFRLRYIKINCLIIVTWILLLYGVTLPANAQTARDIATCTPDTCGYNWNPVSEPVPPLYSPTISDNTSDEGGCTLNLSNFVSCNLTDQTVTLNWTFTDNITNPIEELRISLNRTSTLNFNTAQGDKEIIIDKSNVQSTIDIERGYYYTARLIGTNDSLYQCDSNKIIFMCETSRPSVSGQISILEDNATDEYLILNTSLTSSVNRYIYAFYNRYNSDIAGRPKPVCVEGTSSYQGECPDGSHQLLAYDYYAEGSDTSQIKINYADIIKVDKNDGDKLTDNFVIKVYVSADSLSNGLYTGEQTGLITNFNSSRIIVSNFREESNTYTNMGRFRKVGEWTVDMTPPQVNTPVTTNYLYDSFDTEWRIKTDSPIWETNLGCYNLSNSHNYAVTYLGYLDINKKYQANLPLFTNLNNSFVFEYKEKSVDINNNNILNPSPFPNCVNPETINAFKEKINQPANLNNGGSDVSLITKYKLQQPEDFEEFQHIFKATDYACNTSVSDPGGAGINLPDNWISTDGGTVFYDPEDITAQSPAPPINSLKIDDNLYCTYNYTTPENSIVFYRDANSDDSLLNISKSLLFNDRRGQSYIGAKENEYKSGEDMLLNLTGTSTTHYSSILNQLKAQSKVITMPNTTPVILNTIDDSGCPADDEKCFIEIKTNTTINGDPGITNLVNNFCDKNALFFIDGDLTVNDNIFKNDNIDSCCGFLVNGNITFNPISPATNYNKTRYQNDYLSRVDQNWYNTYECNTGFYYSEENITLNPDIYIANPASTDVTLTDPFMLHGDLVAKGNLIQGRDNGIGNLSRPPLYLSKDSCIMHNFPELTYILLKIRERDIAKN